jgi:hypothetical protein
MPTTLQSVLVYIGLVSALATAVSGMFTALFRIFPNAPILATLASIAGTIGVDLHALTGGEAVARSRVRGYSEMRAVACVALLGGVIACASAATVVPRVLPPVADFATCVTDDAIAKKPLPQIVTDCGGNLADVIVALLESTSTAVQSTPAYVDAAGIARKLDAMHGPVPR